MTNPKNKLARNPWLWTIGILSIIGVIYFLVYTQFNGSASQKSLTFAKEHIAKKSYYKAMLGIGKALYHDKTNAEAYFLWGQIEVEKHQNHPQAIYCFGEAIKYSKKPTAALYYLRGKSYYKLRKFKKAVVDFKEATNKGGQIDSLAYYLKRAKGDLDLVTDFN